MSEGLENAKVKQTKTIKSNYYRHGAYVNHSVIKGTRLFYFYDKENIVILNTETLEIIKEVKVNNKWVDDR
jgi:hypothetical protein